MTPCEGAMLLEPHQDPTATSEDRDPVAAADRLAKILRAHPDWAAGWHALGGLASAAGNRPAACDLLCRASRLELDNLEYLRDAASACSAAGQDARVIQLLAAAAKRPAVAPDALALLGDWHARKGAPGRAAACYRTALRHRPGHADLLNDLGAALQTLGRTAEAEVCYQSALQVDGAHGAAHLNMGGVCFRRNAHEEAVAHFKAALASAPDNAEACNNLAVSLALLKRWSESAEYCRRALNLRPEFAEAAYNLGNALMEMRLGQEAVAHYRHAVRLRPGYFEALLNLGILLSERGDLEEGTLLCRRALALRPDAAQAHYNLGNALRCGRKLAEAAECYRNAIVLDPALAMAHNNLGVVLQDLGRAAEAIESFRRALTLTPNDCGTHMNLGFALLLAGHMREGWLENEWRWQSTTHRPRGFRSPLWEGEPLAGKTILVHSEQGFGDTIHFVRYAGELSRRGANVVLLVQPALVRLVSASFRGCQVLGSEEDVPPHDFNVPLFSLARLCWTGDPPLARQYLRPDREALGQWAHFYPEGALRVGLAWQGNPRHRRDHERSFPLRVCAPLARLGGVRLYNLQGGEARAQASDPQLGFEVIEPAHPLADFSDTAACLQKLDIVVSCDSAVAHLAGALGRPCWLALPFSPDWRWGIRGDTSAWYPSLRLFRQPCPGDWESVFSRMAEAIASRDQRPAQRKESHAGTTGSLQRDGHHL